MKKLFLLLFAISLLFATNTQAQSPTPKVGEDWQKVFFYKYSMATTTKSVTLDFYPDQNIAYLQVQADWYSMTGDSAQIKIYPSANDSFPNSTQINTLNTLKWKNGNGTNITKWDKIDVSKYPIRKIKITLDTLTGITTGNLTLTVKPYFK